jgi:predicted hydrocarbon binding protein
MAERNYQFTWDFIGDVQLGRPNMGNMTRIEVYRLFQYTLRDVLEAEYGTEVSDRILYRAGYLAGKNFCQQCVGHYDDLNTFIGKVQQALLDFKIGILRIENSDLDKAHFLLTVAEDLDCSGLPDMGHAVCTYDEGFIAGIFNAHTGKDFDVKEIDCWCTGDRTCRFEITPRTEQ